MTRQHHEDGLGRILGIMKIPQCGEADSHHHRGEAIDESRERRLGRVMLCGYKSLSNCPSVILAEDSMVQEGLQMISDIG